MLEVYYYQSTIAIIWRFLCGFKIMAKKNRVHQKIQEIKRLRRQVDEKTHKPKNTFLGAFLAASTFLILGGLSAFGFVQSIPDLSQHTSLKSISPNHLSSQPFSQAGKLEILHPYDFQGKEPITIAMNKEMALPMASSSGGAGIAPDLGGEFAQSYPFTSEPTVPNPFRISMLQQQMDPLDRMLEPLVREGRREPIVVGPMIAQQLRGFVPIAQARQHFALKNSLNPYVYANNNPINYSDPSGLAIPGSASAFPNPSSGQCSMNQPDPDWAWCKQYCDQHAQGALAWILCMQSCLRGFK